MDIRPRPGDFEASLLIWVPTWRVDPVARRSATRRAFRFKEAVELTCPIGKRGRERRQLDWDSTPARTFSDYALAAVPILAGSAPRRNCPSVRCRAVPGPR